MTQDTTNYAIRAAALIGLDLRPEHLPGVAANLATAAAMAALVMAVPLAPSDEAAPVYRP